MKSVQLKCYRCGKENDVADMRYAALNRMICKSCMERGKTAPFLESGLPKKVINSGFELKKESRNAGTKTEAKEPVTEYMCTECHYTFKRKKSASVGSCPYCSLEGTLEIKSGKDADYLIKESTGGNFDR